MVKSNKIIPIAKPFLGEEEAQAAREVILSGWVTQGPKVQEFEENFASYVGAKHACAVSNCTAALHLALLAVGVGPGDVVITVSHSFIATANAIRHCGAEPVFVDIDPTTYNISVDELTQSLEQDCVSSKDKLYYKNIERLAVGESPLCNYEDKQGNKGRVAAILAVHQMGMPCEIVKIVALAKQYNLPVVEDAACAIGSEISLDKGKTWEKIGKPHGDIACFSFHPRKVLTTGDGGMLTTNNENYDKKFRLLRQHGMSVSDSARHGAQKVIIEDYLTTGFNYRMTDIQAAVGIEQLKRIDSIISERRRLADLYVELLAEVEGVVPPAEPTCVRTNWQSYPVSLSDRLSRSQSDLMQYLLDNGVSTRPGIMNAHQTKAYEESGLILPESERARGNSILLPLYPGLTTDEINVVKNILRQLSDSA